eukprot:scaffold30420_cov160-Skeletonema_dohrnii-CCMP3373.AAC.3
MPSSVAMARSKADTDDGQHHYIHDGSIYIFKLKLQVLPCRRSPIPHPNASALSMHDLQTSL